MSRRQLTQQVLAAAVLTATVTVAIRPGPRGPVVQPRASRAMVDGAQPRVLSAPPEERRPTRVRTKGEDRHRPSGREFGAGATGVAATARRFTTGLLDWDSIRFRGRARRRLQANSTAPLASFLTATRPRTVAAIGPAPRGLIRRIEVEPRGDATAHAQVTVVRAGVTNVVLVELRRSGGRWLATTVR